MKKSEILSKFSIAEWILFFVGATLVVFDSIDLGCMILVILAGTFATDHYIQCRENDAPIFNGKREITRAVIIALAALLAFGFAYVYGEHQWGWMVVGFILSVVEFVSCVIWYSIKKKRGEKTNG